MKEIAIIVNDLNKTSFKRDFIFSVMDELYKRQIKVTAYSNSFASNFSSCIIKKKTSIKDNFFISKMATSKIIKNINKYNAIIAYDYPASFVLAMIKEGRERKKLFCPKTIKYMYDDPHIIKGYSLEESFILSGLKISKAKIFGIKNYNSYIYYSDFIDINISSSKLNATLASYMCNKNFNVLYPCVSKSFLKNINFVEKRKVFLLLTNENYKKYDIENTIISFYNFLNITKRTDINLVILMHSNNYLDIQNQVSILGIKDNVEFIESSLDNQLPLIASSSFIINTHKNESFDMTLFASWAYNSVPIIDRKSSVSEIATDDVNAIIIDTSNPLLLTNAMIKCVDDDIYTLAANGKNLLEEDFTIESHVDSLLSLIK